MATSGTSGIAAIVLAHDHPAQLRRLSRALAGVELFLHCDARTPDPVYAEMRDLLGPAVTLLPRLRTRRWNWSLVEAELRALHHVLTRSRAEYIVLMSGSCYPLLSVDALTEELMSTPGASRVHLHPLPWEPWNTRLGLEGGLWRLGLRYLRVRGDFVAVHGVPVPLGRRRIPPELRPHGGSQWKVYARAHARRLLEVMDERPDLRRFFTGCFVPDEICVPTVLRSPALVGDIAESIRSADPWVLENAADTQTRRREGGHAQWLGEADFASLREHSRPADGQAGDLGRALFARKFRPEDAALLDRIDAELRVQPGPV